MCQNVRIYIKINILLQFLKGKTNLCYPRYETNTKVRSQGSARNLFINIKQYYFAACIIVLEISEEYVGALF